MHVRLLFLLFLVSFGSECTSKCDSMSPRNAVNYTFCDTNFESHITSRSAVLFNDCYAYCGVSVLHVGKCGCPNECGSEERGVCVNNSCVCRSGWGGRDCLSVLASNDCSGNGGVVATVHGELFCSCNSGFSGPFCGQHSPLFSYPIFNLPNGPPEYSPKDQFQDQHPLFNLSTIGIFFLFLLS